MKKINNVTLCSIAWGSKFIRETYEAYKSFSDKISFERTIFFVNDTTILPKEANQILLPEYFNKKIQLPIVGPINTTDINPYNLFVMKDIYRFIGTNHILFFQNDGYIRNPDAWDDSFLDYDYIGAPWPWEPYKLNPVGNGGFSLRSKKLCNILGNDNFIPAAAPEDVQICVHHRNYLIKNYDIKFAPFDVASRFSVEWHDKYTNQFGFHGKWHINQ